MVSGLLKSIAEAVAGDESVTAWCADRYGKSQTVYVYVDEENPPSESDYPVVAVISADAERGDAKAETVYEIDVGCGVISEEKEESALPGGGRIVEYKGFTEAEEFRTEVENALFRAKILPLDATARSSVVGVFPLFVSYMTLRFKTLKSTRRALPGS